LAAGLFKTAKEPLKNFGSNVLLPKAPFFAFLF